MATHNIEYKIRPPFKTKFRKAEAQPIIEKVITDTLLIAGTFGNTSEMAKAIADKTKSEL